MQPLAQERSRASANEIGRRDHAHSAGNIGRRHFHVGEDERRQQREVYLCENRYRHAQHDVHVDGIAQQIEIVQGNHPSQHTADGVFAFASANVIALSCVSRLRRVSHIFY